MPPTSTARPARAPAPIPSPWPAVGGGARWQARRPPRPPSPRPACPPAGRARWSRPAPRPPSRRGPGSRRPSRWPGCRARRGRCARPRPMPPGLDAQRRLQVVELVGDLPGELLVAVAKVTVGGGALVDRPAQIEVADDRRWAEVEDILDGELDLGRVDGLGPERLHHD